MDHISIAYLCASPQRVQKLADLPDFRARNSTHHKDQQNWVLIGAWLGGADKQAVSTIK